MEKLRKFLALLTFKRIIIFYTGLIIILSACLYIDFKIRVIRFEKQIKTQMEQTEEANRKFIESLIEKRRNEEKNTNGIM